MDMQQVLALAAVIGAALLSIVLVLRTRYNLRVRSHLLLDGLVLTPAPGRQVALVGHHDGVDVSGIVPAADIAYRIESHPKEPFFRSHADGPVSTMVTDWEAPHFTVQLFRADDEIWRRDVLRNDALRIRNKIECLRKWAGIRRTGDKAIHDLELLHH